MNKYEIFSAIIIQHISTLKIKKTIRIKTKQLPKEQQVK